MPRAPRRLPPEQRRDLLEIVEDRRETAPPSITSQLPVDRWYEIIGNPAIADAVLDRLLHDAYRVELTGEGLRERRAAEPRNRAGLTAGTIGWTIHHDPGAAVRVAGFESGTAAGFVGIA